MDIMALHNVSNETIANEASKSLDSAKHATSFDVLLQNAVGQVKETNQLQMDAQTAAMEFSLGESTNTHDLLIAQQKASVALQYTVAVKNNLLESYNSIMNMQI